MLNGRPLTAGACPAYEGITGTAHRGIPSPGAQGRISGRLPDDGKVWTTPVRFKGLFGPSCEGCSGRRGENGEIEGLRGDS